MKKKIIFVFALAMGLTSLQAQRWEPVSQKINPIRKEVNVIYSYKVDLNSLRELLKNAPEAGQGSPVVISLPTTDGRVERFSVYSAPVVAKSMADRYQLGAYSGVGLDNPTKQVRFSTAPNDFQSMLFDTKTGQYEFIEPINKEKDVFGVFFKSNKTSDGTPFECKATEPEQSKKQMKKLLNSKSVLEKSGTFNKSTDQKYRTYRLAVSVNGEYTQLAGGVPQAAARINATINRVNAVYEKDLGIHMIVQDLPQLIFTDPATDPYSNVIANANGSYSAPNSWNLEVQRTLTTTPGVGNGAYDVGHFFGHRGGGGSAGDIGNVCRNPSSNNDATSKGAGITSPSVNDQPFGDAFDIDYVAHELGHQFGGRHTMSVVHPQTDRPIEPGSGSTIMGYAGITQANVQMHSDAYFHVLNIEQIQQYVNSQTCGIVTPVANTPPVIQPIVNKTIPKGTAFVLTASAADAQNDPMTYTWEQYDIALTKFNIPDATRTNGANFRSLSPTDSPTRYFPKLSSVLNGNLTNLSEWETVSNVSREMNFKVTVRDNNPDIAQQQTQSSLVKLNIGNDGPFKVTSSSVYNNTPGAITWDIANTNNNVYNVSNVKIDYTTDNGASWTVITASTPNDGVEPYSFASLATGASLKIRVSAIDNVFYAIGNATVATAEACSSTAPAGVAASEITRSSANIKWTALQGATYSLQYRKTGSATWTTVPVATNSYSFTGLDEATQYEVQIANVCGSTTGSYSASTNFTTLSFSTCAVSSNSSDEFISNVTVTPTGMPAVSNNSGASAYTNYTTDATKLITLKKGSSGNTVSVAKQWTGTKYDEGVTVWIDFNRDGSFSDSEKIFTSIPNKLTPVSGTFSVPVDAYTGGNVIMRVMLAYNTQPLDACTSPEYGETEDYPVLVQDALSTREVAKDNSSIQIYPNPATDVLYINKVSPKAQFTITNMTGQVVMNGQITDNKVSVSKLTTGAYIISIEDKGTTSNLKFVKK
ncbi:propanediol utilization protein [Chryseobacterium lactis]|uniref:Propanediol utilization protein n=1 Tax=Chryseobacterium lactis TaxID=1241981 RepID=A0A3G6RH95_CHRLC|nr:zinc-dependent metalloprotease family protein [Chryseobacterium lactis]AZA83955.1 T9SS C-terminal target domain-containing protein [Chryseobacterium lactis]AZB04341.1 T9SS C-terminal target domain-containing protein [Chryseobacterium lactis]PNW12512.1 propanediol utilization protein [Chryseobacterium lactis]